MFDNFKILFMMFITYAFVGWCMECIYMYLDEHRLTNRGFFIGPYCPIYGFGAVLMSMFLQKYYDDIAALFLFAIVVCSILEYLTGYLLEKIFHARWWDYSDELFNINGRVCLKTMVPFGILGVLMIRIFNPFILKMYNGIPVNIFNIMFYVIAIVFFSDVIFSLYVLVKLRIEGLVVKKDTDNSEEMSKKVMDQLKKLSYPYRRLLEAFPNIRYIGNTIKKSGKAVKNKIIKESKKIRRKNKNIFSF